MPTHAAHPEVQTTAGRVRGVLRGDSAAFLGIPFAEPPVGDLRFAAPVPHRPWEGVRHAVAFGATPQRATLSEITLIPEPSIPGDSTLNVNVFTPAPGDEGARLPVLVYIHGGGFVAGSPASPWYDGAAFNRDGVVTVSVSYRLGFDGFGWIADAPHNRGVRDWLLALEWVRDNIVQFGGDPSRVTIAGQSAGGGAVLTLLAVPAAHDLFSQAVSISGALTDCPLAESEKLGRRLAELAGVSPTRAGLGALDELTILELQERAASPIVGSGEPDPSDPLASLAAFASAGLSWGPVVDGDLLPEATTEAFGHGIGAEKPLMLGTTDNEFSMALDRYADALAPVPAVSLLQRFGLDQTTAEAYERAHPKLGTADVVGQLITDRTFRVPAITVANERAGRVERDGRGAGTWLYRFAWHSPVGGRAGHCLDAPFFFDCLAADRVHAIAGVDAPQALADAVHGSAVSFVTTGDPGWTTFTTADRPARVFGELVHDEVGSYADVDALLIDPVPR